MNIFEQLRKDHDKQRDLLKALIETSGDSEDRNRIYSSLKHELQIHADAEERYFYKPLFDDDLTQDRARHSVAEHHEIDELIEQLDKTDYSSTGWLTIAKTLKKKVEHHLDEEEQEVFQMAGKSLTDKQKTGLANSYEEMMRRHKV